MNRIYSKVWNASLNKLVVASELATCRGSSKNGGRDVNMPRSLRCLAQSIGMAIGHNCARPGWKSAMGALPVFVAVMAPGIAFAQYNAGGGTTSGTGQIAISGNCGGGTDAQTLGGSADYNEIAIGCYAVAQGINAMALGQNAKAQATGAVALGVNSTASATYATALGVGSVASATNATALGVAATASGSDATAIGEGAQASIGSTALGGGTIANGNGAIAAGLGAQAATDHSTAIGWQAYATALNSIYIGPRTTGVGASAESAIAIGTDVQSSGTYAVAMGLQANASGASAVATGVKASAAGSNAVAVGPTANASADFSLALGNQVAATGVGSVAEGSGAQSTGTSAVAVGNNAYASQTEATALGAGANATQANAVAIGALAVANGAQGIAIGHATSAQAASTVVIGDSSSVSATAGTGSFAGGYQSKVLGGTGAVAIGQQQTVNGNGAVAIGDPNTATGNGAVAMGANDTATGDGAVAIGNNNSATGQGAVALGNASNATAASALAFGDTATASQTNAIALGAGATAGTQAGDVALGSGSVTAAVVNTATATVNGITYSGFAGTNATSTVSVGATGAPRTLTHVAAGQVTQTSTDAINGSELYSVANTLTSQITAAQTHDYSVNSVSSGTDTNYNNAGATGSNAMAAGVSAVASGTDATAVGNGANAIGTNSTALGNASTASLSNAVAIGSGATAGANAGDVALGAGSVTSTVVQTGGTTIGSVNYTFAGATPSSTVSVGNGGNERTITNVAAGRIGQSSTDAINGSELYATNQAIDSLSTTVNNGLTHYYSTNDGGTQQANYDNKGATGTDSLAAGVAASASTTNATALGYNTQATITDSVALGSGAVSDRALAPATGTVGGTYIPYNTTDRTLLGAVSVGSSTSYRQITNVADGTATNDAVTVRQLTGALGSFATTTTKYFHANSTDADSLAVGNNAIAVGPNTVTNGDNGVAMGNGAIVQQNAPGGVAIGENATSYLQDSIAMGTNASAGGIQAVSIGAGAITANPTSVALGAGANASAQAGDVALGANSTTSMVHATSSVMVGGNTYAVAGTAPTSTVSVGSAGNERTVTNVAAGQVSATSTDAINGSELYATNQQVDANTSAISNLNNTVTNITSGSSSKYYSVSSGGNASSATGTNAVAAGPSSTASGNNSVAIGGNSSASGNNSVALGASSTDDGRSNVVSVGSSTQQRQITNVAAGTATTDAANVGQVNQGVQTAENWAQNYTDQRLAAINHDLNAISNRADAGIAAGIAMASLGQAYQPNLSTFGVGVGAYHGEAGVAVGLSTISESGRYIFKLAASSNTQGDVGVGGSVNVVW